MQGFFSTPFLFFTICFTSSPATFLSILSSPHFSLPSPNAQLLAAWAVHQQSCWSWWNGPANYRGCPTPHTITFCFHPLELQPLSGKGRLNTSGNLQLNSSVTAWTKVMMIAGSCSHCAIVKTTQDYFLRHSIASGNTGRMGHQTSSYCCCEFHLNLLY